MDLTNDDYRTILNYYNIPSATLRPAQIRTLAESILASKLCRCIKAVTPHREMESKAIGICKSSILKRRGLTSGRFECKKKARFLSMNRTNRKLRKTKKKLTMKNRKRPKR